MKNNEYIEVINKEVWIPEIEQRIVDWKEFSESAFCEDEEDKKSAMATVDFYKNVLDAIKTDTVTQDMWVKVIYALR